MEKEEQQEDRDADFQQGWAGYVFARLRLMALVYLIMSAILLVLVGSTISFGMVCVVILIIILSLFR